MRCSACRLLLERNSSEDLPFARSAARSPRTERSSPLFTHASGPSRPRREPLATLPPSWHPSILWFLGRFLSGTLPLVRHASRWFLGRFLSGTLPRHASPPHASPRFP